MNQPPRVLVLGASGMLGSVVAAELSGKGYSVVAASRQPVPLPRAVSALPIGDLATDAEPARAMDVAAPDAVVNCAGWIKQREAHPVAKIAVNALLPHRLAALCRRRGARLIQISTDCVFSGAVDSRRGPCGYRENDPADADDCYGLSKRLGEVTGPGCLTLRMSLIGREPSGSRRGLVEWFLAAPAPLRGFSQARFTGMTATVGARLIAQLLREPDMQGLWHAAAEPISKLELLRAMAARVRPGLAIEAVAEPVVDRRLDGTALATRTGWFAPSWPHMLDELFGEVHR